MFNRIVSVDAINLSEEALNEIKKCSKRPTKFYDTDPKNVNEMIKRVGNADCVLISWRTKLGKEIFETCKNIKYIGLCATSFANIAVDEARKRKIVISNVVDYGDEATAEYIFAQLLSLFRGLGEYQWKKAPCELFGKNLGIIGLGAVGKQVARLGLGFGMNVAYHSRTRRPEFEKKGLKFMSLHDMIRNSDIISLHVPKDTTIFSRKEFDIIPKNTILVNSCLGKVFDEEDFAEWIKKGDNFAVFDYSVDTEYYNRLKNMKNVIFPKIIAGKTMESKQRLSMKVVENIKSFLDNKPTNVVRS
ncbi:MAG: dihydrofolate reductase [Candidatus Aenigmarchaeota archaeon]|nr:dihydrofolate reductase [Candidatus Aenigmarchaeota archaeon]